MIPDGALCNPGSPGVRRAVPPWGPAEGRTSSERFSSQSISSCSSHTRSVSSATVPTVRRMYLHRTLHLVRLSGLYHGAKPAGALPKAFNISFLNSPVRR